nr:MAG TPA: ANC1-like domain protein [Caudoviricetes sp.]
MFPKRVKRLKFSFLDFDLCGLHWMRQRRPPLRGRELE